MAGMGAGEEKSERERRFLFFARRGRERARGCAYFASRGSRTLSEGSEQRGGARRRRNRRRRSRKGEEEQWIESIVLEARLCERERRISLCLSSLFLSLKTGLLFHSTYFLGRRCCCGLGHGWRRETQRTERKRKFFFFFFCLARKWVRASKARECDEGERKKRKEEKHQNR